MRFLLLSSCKGKSHVGAVIGLLAFVLVLSLYMEKLAKEQTGGAGQGIFATHPGMTERLAKARSVIAEKKWAQTTHSARDRRFQQALG